MTKLWSALAMLAIAGIPRRAAAEGPPIELAWDAPAGCPEGSFVRRRIEQLVPGAQASPARVEAKVERGADGRFRLTATVRTGDLHESRTIDAASCSALAEAFAVVIAFMLDPENEPPRLADEGRSAEPAAPPAPAPPPEGAPPAGAHASAEVPPKSPPPRGPRSSAPAAELAVGLGGALATGPMPGATPGMVASAGLRLGRLRVGALGTVSFRRSASLTPTAGMTFEMVEVGGYAGYLVPLGAFAVGPSANVEATYIHVRGFGVRAPWTSSRTWLTGVLGARAEARVTRAFGLFARTELLLPIGAPSFTLATRGDSIHLYEPPAWALRFSLGAEIVFR